MHALQTKASPASSMSWEIQTGNGRPRIQTSLHVHHLPGIPVDLAQLINLPLHYSKGVEQDWNGKHIGADTLFCPVSSEDQMFRSRFLYSPRRVSLTLGASCARWYLLLYLKYWSEAFVWIGRFNFFPPYTYTLVCVIKVQLWLIWGGWIQSKVGQGQGA